MKLGKTHKGWNFTWIAFAAVTMTTSGILLMLAQKEIPIGTAYAVWTGIGSVGAFVLGLLLFKESAEIKHFIFREIFLYWIDYNWYNGAKAST